MPSRRRGEELEATILEAAWAEIQEHGYNRLTIEGVAARAQTGKQVLYRRWPNRAQLAVAAIRHTLGPLLTAAPDTGSLREDYFIVLRLMAGRARHYTPELLHGLMPEVWGVTGEISSALPGVIDQILRNAAARGEIAHADLPERVAMLPLDLIRYEGMRNVVKWAEITEGDAEKVVADILDTVFLPLVMALAGPAKPG
ncbi:TetR/AcrR family transcriptional regulator [Paractinoplanes toevensis]|uniref:TetR family transcriptional regulator n=1 Tax=Paractinoplanes toevensis TaxID=571911 RepID=A0A919T8A8_9ACTN|nr:TetR/AcrR family transcriptional regulator [Actinoplanes toevensis]GIM90703.1 TetR family transcriptional regulator [Actinoplanes toevensis]